MRKKPVTLWCGWTFLLLPSEIVWLVARLPLNVAAQARPLIRRHRLPREDGVQRSPKVFARDGNRVTRPALIELTAIRQLPAAIEQEEIGSAGSAIGLGHGLAFVVKIRERVTRKCHFFRHLRGPVVGIFSGII